MTQSIANSALLDELQRQNDRIERQLSLASVVAGAN
jgi:hypothetical protein